VSRRTLFGIIAALVLLLVFGAAMASIGNRHSKPQPAQTTRTR
jgi:hypothetical protein